MFFGYDLTRAAAKNDWHLNYTVFISFDIQGTKILSSLDKIKTINMYNNI